MLVLTRRRGESILIGEEVTVMVLSINANRVRLGITAPSSMGIRRDEIEIELNEAPESGDGLTSTDSATGGQEVLTSQDG